MKKILALLTLWMLTLPAFACTVDVLGTGPAFSIEDQDGLHQSIVQIAEVVCDEPTQFSLELEGTSSGGLVYLDGEKGTIPVLVRDADTKAPLGSSANGEQIQGTAGESGTIIHIETLLLVDKMPATGTYFKSVPLRVMY